MRKLKLAATIKKTADMVAAPFSVRKDVKVSQEIPKSH